MSHLESYLDRVRESSPELIGSIESTVNDLIPNHIDNFSHKEHIMGLLLGQVQSGKTSHILGIIAAAADADDGFLVFILLTGDMTGLQQQTFIRVLESLDTFNVCDEHDELRFLESGQRKPAIIVLKKNTNILKKWYNIIKQSDSLKGRPIFIVDDEGDAASLNTKINTEEERSSINRHLNEIAKLSTSSFYLQVTATPQALLLQTEKSGWKPSFIHYFDPGKGYLGGEFFYSKPKSFTCKYTNEDELEEIIDTNSVPDGLKEAIETFLITSSHSILKDNSSVCNFLIHPSVKKVVHEKIRLQTEEYTNYIFAHIKSHSVKESLRKAWAGLQSSKPDLIPFDEIYSLLSEQKLPISIYKLNSDPNSNSRKNFDRGFNIIIGGNSLGRGVTFRALQTVYYCRTAKRPQIDTFWQHCRMFGYDRDPQLMRVFIPASLYDMFAEISASNEMLIKQVVQGEVDKIQIVTNTRIKPTRKNVINPATYDFIVGGVDYFPRDPEEFSPSEIDEKLKGHSSEETYDFEIDSAIELMNMFPETMHNGWSIRPYLNALHAIKSHRELSNNVKLIIRRNRNVSKGTGTLLSENDRAEGSKYCNECVITIYRLNGDTKNGWKGNPFWVPNIKLPAEKVFHRAE